MIKIGKYLQIIIVILCWVSLGWYVWAMAPPLSGGGCTIKPGCTCSVTCNCNGIPEASLGENPISCASDFGFTPPEGTPPPGEGTGACDNDGVCEAMKIGFSQYSGENHDNCSQDCPCNNNYYCERDKGETDSCTNDCGEACYRQKPYFKSSCNENGKCELALGENSNSCLVDCGCENKKFLGMCIAGSSIYDAEGRVSGCSLPGIGCREPFRRKCNYNGICDCEEVEDSTGKLAFSKVCEKDCPDCTSAPSPINGSYNIVDSTDANNWYASCNAPGYLCNNDGICDIKTGLGEQSEDWITCPGDCYPPEVQQKCGNGKVEKFYLRQYTIFNPNPVVIKEITSSPPYLPKTGETAFFEETATTCRKDVPCDRDGVCNYWLGETKENCSDCQTLNVSDIFKREESSKITTAPTGCYENYPGSSSDVCLTSLGIGTLSEENWLKTGCNCNGYCETALCEGFGNCAGDCGTCGNGVCNLGYQRWSDQSINYQQETSPVGSGPAGETPNNCSQDCHCGNGVCDYQRDKMKCSLVDTGEAQVSIMKCDYKNISYDCVKPLPPIPVPVEIPWNCMQAGGGESSFICKGVASGNPAQLPDSCFPDLSGEKFQYTQTSESEFVNVEYVSVLDKTKDQCPGGADCCLYDIFSKKCLSKKGDTSCPNGCQWANGETMSSCAGDCACNNSGICDPWENRDDGCVKDCICNKNKVCEKSSVSMNPVTKDAGICYKGIFIHDNSKYPGKVSGGSPFWVKDLWGPCWENCIYHVSGTKCQLVSGDEKYCGPQNKVFDCTSVDYNCLYVESEFANPKCQIGSMTGVKCARDSSGNPIQCKQLAENENCFAGSAKCKRWLKPVKKHKLCADNDLHLSGKIEAFPSYDAAKFAKWNQEPYFYGGIDEALEAGAATLGQCKTDFDCNNDGLCQPDKGETSYNCYNDCACEIKKVPYLGTERGGEGCQTKISYWAENNENCSSDCGKPLVIKTLSADNITANGAELVAELEGMGYAAKAKVWFEYYAVIGEEAQLPLKVWGVFSTTSPGVISLPLVGLQPGTKYQFKALAQNSADSKEFASGDSVEFTTASSNCTNIEITEPSEKIYPDESNTMKWQHESGASPVKCDGYQRYAIFDLNTGWLVSDSSGKELVGFTLENTKQYTIAQDTLQWDKMYALYAQSCDNNNLSEAHCSGWALKSVFTPPPPEVTFWSITSPGECARDTKVTLTWGISGGATVQKIEIPAIGEVINGPVNSPYEFEFGYKSSKNVTPKFFRSSKGALGELVEIPYSSTAQVSGKVITADHEPPLPQFSNVMVLNDGNVTYDFVNDSQGWEKSTWYFDSKQYRDISLTDFSKWPNLGVLNPLYYEQNNNPLPLGPDPDPKNISTDLSKNIITLWVTDNQGLSCATSTGGPKGGEQVKFKNPALQGTE